MKIIIIYISSTMTQITETKPIVILDANAFITGSGLLDLGSSHQLFTTPAVLQQLRDVKTRQLLEKFIFQIHELEPSKKSLQLVKQFAKKTGDISSLSDVDLELLALAHTLYVSRGLEEKLRKTPPPLKQVQPKQENNEEYSNQQYEEQEEEEQDKEEEQTKIINKQQEKTVEQNKKPEQEQKKIEDAQSVQKTQSTEATNKNDNENVKQEQQQQEEWIVVAPSKKNKRKQTDDDMGQDEGWITPQNFQKKMAEGTAVFENQQALQNQPSSSCGISLMTADFAMQNVAIQMGIQLKSLDGRQIKEVRRFILECYLCWKQYKVDDNQVKLCKQCGYNSLSKLAYSLTPKGEMILHRKKGWKPNKKVLEWKQRKYEEQQKIKKNQRARRKKQPSIFDV